MKKVLLTPDNAEQYASYLRDESRLCGMAAELAFPSSPEELSEYVRKEYDSGHPVVIQGARTGVSGGAVPAAPDSRVIALEEMAKAGDIEETKDGTFIWCEPGLRLFDLHRIASKAHAMFPPDPSEDTATIGGIIANSATGMNGCRAGRTGDHLQAVRVLLANGSIITLQRGEHFLRKDGFSLPDGRTCTFPEPLPEESRLSVIPHAGEDLVDLFAGSEGAYGILTELRLRLVPEDAALWGIWFFFSSDKEALLCTGLVRQHAASAGISAVRALDYLDSGALQAAEEARAHSSRLEGLPALPEDTNAAVYLELAGGSEEAVEEILAEMAELLESEGIDIDRSWTASDRDSIGRFRAYRHAVPEQAGLRVDRLRAEDPGLRLAALDLGCPAEAYSGTVTFLHEKLSSLRIQGFLFGHAMDGRIHLMLLPESKEELAAAEAFFRQLTAADPEGTEAEETGSFVPEVSGTAFRLLPAVENGVGRLRADLFAGTLSPAEHASLRAVKDFFDPKGLLNPGSFLLKEAQV